MPSIKLPAPVMAFAMTPTKGDEDKVFTALRRLQEEDPTLDVHRDAQTGEMILAGLSQMHVEVVVGRLKDRFGCEVDLKPPRVPYQETIRKPGQGPRAPQEADGRARPVRRLPHRDRAGPRQQRPRVRRQDQGRRDPERVHPGDREGRARRDGARGRSPATRSSDVGVTRRRRPVPLGRLVGGGVPHRGVAGDEGGDGEGRRGPARADHARDAVGARGVGGRRHRRPQLPARPPAGDGAGRAG